jgi:hypothetical protein
MTLGTKSIDFLQRAAICLMVVSPESEQSEAPPAANNLGAPSFAPLRRVGSIDTPARNILIYYLFHVPTGLKRYQEVEEFHFITFSCYQRKPFLGRCGRVSLPHHTVNFFPDEPQTTRRIWGTRLDLPARL